MAMIRLILPLLFACAVAAETRRAVREPKADTRVESALIDDVRKNPDDFQANHRLADYYRASQRMDVAIPFFEKAYQLNPGDYSNAWDLALSYMTAHKIKEARKLPLGLQRQNDKAELHNLLGSIEEAAGCLRAAVLEYQRAAQMEPNEKNVFDYATG